jgi:aminoglycoside 6'-N-acetyltransferase
VARWWGDADQVIAVVRRQSPTTHALIAVDATPVGYLCWQHPPPAELSAAGLGDLPATLIDVDLLIGEPDRVGHGIGPQALALLLARLRSEGHSLVGMGTAAANQRALRAFEKAGFQLFRAFEENGQPMCYLVQSLDASV